MGGGAAGGGAGGGPLVRVEREGQVFRASEVRGRDAAEVFPRAVAAAAGVQAAALQAAAGAVRFVTEAELVAEKEGGGGGGGGGGALRPLAQVLEENREKKEAEFQEKWRTMKEGKNRPLDADEVDFLEGLEAAEQDRRRAAEAEEEEGLLAFQLAQAEEGLLLRQEPVGTAAASPAGAAVAAPPKCSKTAAAGRVGSKRAAPAAPTLRIVTKKKSKSAAARPGTVVIPAPSPGSPGEVTNAGATAEGEGREGHAGGSEERGGVLGLGSYDTDSEESAGE